MGRLEDARAQAAQVLRLDPKFSVARYDQALTYRLPEHARRTHDALRGARTARVSVAVLSFRDWDSKWMTAA